MGPFLDPRDLIIMHGPDHSQQTHEAEICNAPSIFKSENSPKGAADMPGSDDPTQFLEPSLVNTVEWKPAYGHKAFPAMRYAHIHFFRMCAPSCSNPNVSSLQKQIGKLSNVALMQLIIRSLDESIKS